MPAQIWHHWTVHSTSANLSDNVREGIIARFHTTVHGDAMQLDDGGVATDGDLWKFWGPAVREASEGGAEHARL